MTHKHKLLDFLKSQKLMAIASRGDDLWITNIFYGVDDNFKIYFVSNSERKHSKQIKENPEVAFSVAWYNPKDHKDRKGIQGQGTCRVATSDEEITKGIQIHNELYPEFAERIVVAWIKSKLNNSHVYIIDPKYIKYWDDNLYGTDGTEEFNF